MHNFPISVMILFKDLFQQHLFNDLYKEFSHSSSGYI